MSVKGLMRRPRQELLVAYLAAAAVSTHILESVLPGIGPWFKPGLANTFTLVAFFHLGWKAAASVSLIRVFVGSLAMGTFLSPTFFLSLSGSAGVVFILGLVSHLQRNGPYSKLAPNTLLAHNGVSQNIPFYLSQNIHKTGLGPVGISLLAALAHMSFQVCAAWILIIGHTGIFLALPWFMLGSWLTGIFNGLLAFLILERMARFDLW